MNIKLSEYASATIEEVRQAEQTFHATFPEDYKTFVVTYNGAVPEDNILIDNADVGISYFIPINDAMYHLSITEGLPTDAWPIAELVCGNLLFIRRNSPIIFFWDHETNDNKPVASSFKDLLDKLVPFGSDHINLRPEQVISVWVKPGFKPEF